MAWALAWSGLSTCTSGEDSKSSTGQYLQELFTSDVDKYNQLGATQKLNSDKQANAKNLREQGEAKPSSA